MNSLDSHRFAIFQLWYLFEQSASSRVNRSLLILYNLGCVASLATMKDIGIFNFDISLGQFGFIAAFVCLGIILVESAIYVQFGIQFFLNLQLRILRFSFLQLGVKFSISQIILSGNSSPIFLSMSIIYLLASFTMVLFVRFEEYHQKSLIIEYSSLSFYLFNFSMISALSQSFTLLILKETSLVILLIVQIMALQMLNQLCLRQFEFKIYSLLIELNIMVTAYMLLKLIINSSSSYLFYFTLLFIYVMIGLILYFRRKIFQSIVIQFDEIDGDSFIRKVQSIAFEIDEVMKGNVKIWETELIGFMKQHQKNCSFSYCPLLGEQAKKQIRLIQQNANLKNILNKIKKHLQYLFQRKQAISNQKQMITLAYLHFMAYYSFNKSKSLELYRLLSLFPNTWRVEYTLFKINNKINETATDDTLNSHISTMSHLQTFTNHITVNVELIMDICNCVFEDKVDFNRLTSIAYHYHENRLILDNFIHQIVNQKSFAAYRVLSIYAECLSEIFLETDAARKLLDDRRIIMDYLESTKDLQYLSAKSELGLVAISLSQKSLGNIVFINPYAENIFGFYSKQLIGKKVNKIMPDTFAAYHDSLLQVFLENKTKRVNGDERVLVAKHKNGYIMPIMLRLQRTISTENQLIFIANIRKYKTKETPLIAIVQPEGKIIDFSAGFQYNFMRKERSTDNLNHMCEIVPEFQQIYLLKSSCMMITCQKYNRKITAEFKITPLSFFNNLQAYLFIGSKITYNTSCKPITSTLSQYILNGQLRCHQNTFAIQPQSYELNNRQTICISKFNEYRQFTLPFLRFSQIQNLFFEEDEIINYAYNILTVRLKGVKFETVYSEETQENQSEDQGQASSIEDKMQNIIRQQENQYDSIGWINKSLSVTIAAAGILSIGLYATTGRDSDHKNSIFASNMNIVRIKGELANFLIFSMQSQVQNNDDYYISYLQSIEGNLIAAIQYSTISQQLKQNYMHIIYSKGKYQELQLSLALIQDTYPLQLSSTDLCLIIWYLNYGLVGALSILLILSLFQYKQRLYRIYSYFLFVEGEAVQAIYQKSKLLKIILEDKFLSYKQSQLQQQRLQLKPKPEQNNQIRKYKSFKNQNRGHDLIIAAQYFILVVILVLIISATVSLYSRNSMLLQQYEQIQIEINQIISQTSLFILKSYLSNRFNNSQVITHFQALLQSIDFDLLSIATLESNVTFTNMANAYSNGNLCTSSILPSTATKECMASLDGIATKGLSEALNYLLTTLTDTTYPNFWSSPLFGKISKRYVNSVKFNENIIDQSMQGLLEQLASLKQRSQSKFEQVHFILISIFLFVLISQHWYLSALPFKKMQQQVVLTRRIINLFKYSRDNMNSFTKR